MWDFLKFVWLAFFCIKGPLSLWPKTCDFKNCFKTYVKITTIFFPKKLLLFFSGFWFLKIFIANLHRITMIQPTVNNKPLDRYCNIFWNWPWSIIRLAVHVLSQLYMINIMNTISISGLQNTVTKKCTRKPCNRNHWWILLLRYCNL